MIGETIEIYNVKLASLYLFRNFIQNQYNIKQSCMQSDNKEYTKNARREREYEKDCLSVLLKICRFQSFAIFVNNRTNTTDVEI